MKKTITLSLLSSLLLSNLFATPIELDEVTVEAANRTEQNIKDLTESVTIISAQEIEESHVRTLGEALAQLSNIALVNNGGIGKTTSFLTRGMDSKRTLVLIDGIRYNNVTGSTQYQHILLSNIERIEIIKGAQSGIWGADASAGVINVVTKSAQKGTHVSATTEAGSFNTQQGSIQLSHKTDLFDVTAGLARIKTDGFSSAEPQQGIPEYGKRGDELGWEDDGYANNTYDIKIGLNLTEQDRIEASYQRIDAFSEYDGGAGVDAQNYDDPWASGTISPYFEKTDNRFYSAAYKHQNKVNDLELKYSYSYFNNKVSTYKGNVQETSLQDRINYADDSFLRIGGSYQKFKHNKVEGTKDEKYSDKAIYLTNYNKFSDLLSLGHTIFTQSLRFDDYSTFDNKTTGKVGLKQFIYDNDIYLSSNYGTAYNVPTLAELYGFWGPNPDLQPETTKTLDFTLGNDKLTLTYFYTKVTNMIEWYGVWPAAGYQNVSGISRLKGIEAGYKDDFFDVLAVSFNYTYLDAKNADGEFLRSRPKHQIDGNIVYYVNEDMNIGVNGQYLGERYDRDDRQGAQTGKYAVYNAVINYTINDNFTVYGKIDNIGDKYYQVRDGYATAERSYYAGLNAKF